METVLEVGAIDEQARSLLQTVEQMSGQLREFRSQRQHKAHLFLESDHRLFDETDYYTQEAINQIAGLVEGVRADAETGGRIRFRTRIKFAFRDTQKVQVALTQLGIAAQSLNRDLATIANKNWKNPPQPAIEVSQYFVPVAAPQPYDPNKIHEFYNPHVEPREVKPPPPAYEEALFMAERRQRNQERRANLQPGSPLSSRRSVSSLAYSPDMPSQYRPSAEIALELPSDDGFGPMFDRSPTRTASIAPSDELFFESALHGPLPGSATQLDRPSLSYRALSGPSQFPNDEHLQHPRAGSAVSGRQRSMMWLEAQSGDSFG